MPLQEPEPEPAKPKHEFSGRVELGAPSRSMPLSMNLGEGKELIAENFTSRNDSDAEHKEEVEDDLDEVAQEAAPREPEESRKRQKMISMELPGSPQEPHEGVKISIIVGRNLGEA